MTRNLEVLLTLFQPEGADCVHHITASTPGFENLTTSLLNNIYSAHRTPNFTNPEFCVYLLFEYFFQIEVLNQYQNALKDANVTLYIKKKNQLKFGKLKFGIGKIGCSMS